MTVQPTTEAIWKHLSADLRRFIRHRVRDESVADDLLQETFLRVHRHIGTLQLKERLAAWVYQIARNVVHDHYRNASDSPGRLAGTDDLTAPEDDAQAVGRDILWLDKMIQSLPDGYGSAVRMAEIEQLSGREVAVRLGLSLSAAKSRIQRGKAMLKDLLQACCVFELDGRGGVMGCDPRADQQVCQDC